MERASYAVALLAVTCLIASVNVFAQSNIPSFLNDVEPDNTAWMPDNSGNDGNPSPPAPVTPTPPTTPATPSPSAGSPPASTGACPGDPGYQEPWDSTFWDNFNIVTNGTHVRVSADGDACDMQLDADCSAVFGSKYQYFTGYFSAKLQLPCGNSSGTVFAFYTSSDGKMDDHDEIDIELLGNETSKHITMQTNIFINGVGDREMRHNLDWFDPCTSHHDYFIKWNSNMVVVGVDDIPLRVHMNNEKNGLPYFNKGQGLYVSYWDGSSWATQGGRIKIDYAMNAPFIANLNGFHHMSACQVPSERDLGSCKYPAVAPCWDRPSDHYLTAKQKTDFEWANNNFCIYDYCKDDQRFASTGKPAECNIPLY